MLENKVFSPIFIVGAPRCGTTLLAVLLDRHSRIAVSPETHFFDGFCARSSKRNDSKRSREEMVQEVLSYWRIGEIPIGHAQVLAGFAKYPKSYGNLFRAILETYARSQGKQRPAEKSPQHIYQIPFILETFPNAKIICMIRDARDMVLSMMKVPWGWPKTIGHYCVWWQEAIERALYYINKYPYRFMLVKYEELVLHPASQLKFICSFIGESFEAQQLQPQSESGVITERSRGWIGKANEPIDLSRNQAWRREASQKEIWAINSKLGSLLQTTGYEDNDLKDCPMLRKIYFKISQIPYSRLFRPFARYGIKSLQPLKRIYDLTVSE